MKLQIHGQNVEFLPQRALYLPELGILALSDLQLIRRESLNGGDWSPMQLNRSDLGRVLRLVKELEPESLYMIGAFTETIIHFTPELAEEVKAWRSEMNCEIVLLEANLDRRVQPFLLDWRVTIAESITAENFVFACEPSAPEKFGQIVVSGHLRPVVTVENGGERKARPCFVWEESQIILPSFSETTEVTEVQRHPVGRYFSVNDSLVAEVV